MSDQFKPDRSRTTKSQLVRYGVVGAASNIAGYLVYLLLTFLGMDPKLAVIVLYPIGATLGFIGNRSYTFSSRSRWMGSALRYALAHIVGLGLDVAILAVFVDRLRYSHAGVQAVAVLFVAAYLFVAFKLFVFPAGRAEPMKESR